MSDGMKTVFGVQSCLRYEMLVVAYPPVN